MSSAIAARLKQLGIVLPVPPRPAANYRPYAIVGGMVLLAGVAPSLDGRYIYTGKVGRDLSFEEARGAARLCALNLLANLQLACSGDLDLVKRILMVRGFVNAVETFQEIPRVIDGASDLLVEIFGEDAGRHARTSVGCSSLPAGVAVEVDAIVDIES